MIYYHIDRKATLHEGEKINLNSEFVSNNPACQILIEKMFPNGVSKHGENYLNDCVYHFLYPPIHEILAACNNFNSIRYAEYTFELVRRLYFQKSLSRYTSLFVLPDISELSNWPELNINNCPIYEVYTDCEYPIYDANYLKGGLSLSEPALKMYQGFSPGLNFQMAIDYWSRKISDTPKFETLLPLPITVGKRIR